MSFTKEPLPDHLTVPSRIGDEISITGKWVPRTPGGRFGKSEDSSEMLQEWEDIHVGARSNDGVLSTEIYHGVGEETVLNHHVFENPDAPLSYTIRTYSKFIHPPATYSSQGSNDTPVRAEA